MTLVVGFCSDAVLVCPRELFVCDLVLTFQFENVSETVFNECLGFTGCCLGYSPCLWSLSWLLSMSLVIVLVTLHVSGHCLGYSPCLWLLSWLLSMSLVVVLVTLHVSGCCLGYSPCLLVVVLVTLHV